MKILYLAVGVFDKGGISRYCRYQVRALRELVGREHVAVYSLVGRSENDFEDEFAVDRTFGGFGIGNEARFLQACVNTAWAKRPNVVWSSHLRFLPNGLLGRWLSGGRFAVNVYGEEAWSGKLLPLVRRMLPRADLVLSDCYFTNDFVAGDYGIAANRRAVVWDCVDLERFEPGPRRSDLIERYGLPQRSGIRYVMTLGRIEARSRYKGYDRLLDAFKALSGSRDLVLLYAGTGDDVERLRMRAVSEGLGDRVFFLGSIPESELCDVYNLCDVFALVSDRGPGRGEGIPLTPLEAAACAKPIIVGDEDGSREAVINGENGFCVSPRDPDALKNALEAILGNDELRARMAAAARARIEGEFSYPTFRDKTSALLDKLMA